MMLSEVTGITGRLFMFQVSGSGEVTGFLGAVFISLSLFFATPQRFKCLGHDIRQQAKRKKKGFFRDLYLAGEYGEHRFAGVAPVFYMPGKCN